MVAAVRSLVTETGNMFAITLEAFRIMWRPPYPWREFIRQCWFIASVSMLPAVLVSIAFGATIALQVGNIARSWEPKHRPERRWFSPSSARPLRSSRRS